jgi:hypothetical protein
VGWTSKEDLFRCGVIVGSGIGGLNEFEEQHRRFIEGGPGRINPFVIPKMIGNAAAGNISIEFGLAGPNTNVATACASAAHSIGDGCEPFSGTPRMSCSPAAPRRPSRTWASAVYSASRFVRPQPGPAGRQLAVRQGPRWLVSQ